MNKSLYHHVLLPLSPETSRYTNPNRSRSSHTKQQNRESHGTYLLERLALAWKTARDEFAVYNATRDGIYIEFRGENGYDLAINSLEYIRMNDPLSNIHILNIREEDGTTYASVYVPKEKEGYYLKKVEQYLTDNTKSGDPKNRRLLDNINDIRNALNISAFWLDPPELIPQQELEWCEIWLSSIDPDVKNNFDNLLKEQGISFKDGYIDFPDRSIKLVLVNQTQLSELIIKSDAIAEIRKAKVTAAFWENITNADQTEWVTDLLERLAINRGTNTSVCILDTGVNYGHPLLRPIIGPDDCQAVREEWGTYDHDSHGTFMAGVIGYGDLIKCLLDTEQVTINHLLESVKILPPNHYGGNDPELWGFITKQAVSLSEIQAPERKRIICMAVAASDTRDRGRPSSWSGSLDQITSGADEENQTKRIFIVSAGNITDDFLLSNYPNSQLSNSIHDPGQAWNVLTVGAYTNLCDITDETFKGYQPIAPMGGISPFTTTSITWNDEWPIKPDVVMEGGNAAISDNKEIESDCADLAILSTSYNFQRAHFSHFNMTSAATANAAWFAAQIVTQYPKFWPETVRGLVVHSAEWTDTQKEMFLRENSKRERKDLLRICGYGVPNLDRALYSAANDLTIISQTTIQPYKQQGTEIRTWDMHLYDLPWPTAVLDLPPDIDIKMRVTLSYFIEPSPGERGWKNRYRYPSFSLKFLLKSPQESKPDFLKRINEAAREENEDYQPINSDANYWYFGAKIRHRGSIHSDIWIGTPQELADSNIIAIVPGGGWWKERKHLNKGNEIARYSLIVSIYTPIENVDIYTPVVNMIKIPVKIVVS